MYIYIYIHIYKYIQNKGKSFLKGETKKKRKEISSRFIPEGATNGGAVKEELRWRTYDGVAAMVEPNGKRKREREREREKKKKKGDYSLQWRDRIIEMENMSPKPQIN